MRTERGFDRIVNFSDATVAIAITLLVLPLVELGGELEGADSVSDVFRDHRYDILGFVVSFLVIWTMWTAHHRILEYFTSYDAVVVRLHMVWLLTIVSIPFTTQLLTNVDLYTHGAAAVYVGVLLVNSACVHLIGQRGRQHPELLRDSPEVRTWLSRPYRWTTVGLLALILLVVVAVPPVGAVPLLLLLVDPAVERALDRRQQRRV